MSFTIAPRVLCFSLKAWSVSKLLNCVLGSGHDMFFNSLLQTGVCPDRDIFHHSLYPTYWTVSWHTLYFSFTAWCMP